MLKRLIIILTVLILLGLLSLFAYTVASPEIVVVNHSSDSIEEVVVRLPSNRVVFDSVPANHDATIYYSWSQSDGAYEYEIRLPNQIVRSGLCGHVTNGEVGKRLILTVEENLEIICTESSKV